jgi:hypothetical protein
VAAKIREKNKQQEREIKHKTDEQGTRNFK